MRDKNRPQWSGPPQGVPEAPRHRRGWAGRHKILTVLITLIALIALIAVIVIAASSGGGGGGGGGNDTAPKAPTTTAPDGEERQEEPRRTEGPGIGDPVRDGKFEFTVTKVQPGVQRIGDEFGDEAQGQFVLVHMTVENIGDESQLFDGSSQKLFDSKDREFSADSGAAVYLNESESFLNEINPGNKVNGIVVFDVPKDVEPVKIELHDSAFSGGATVNLGRP